MEKCVEQTHSEKDMNICEGVQVTTLNGASVPTSERRVNLKKKKVKKVRTSSRRTTGGAMFVDRGNR